MRPRSWLAAPLAVLAVAGCGSDGGSPPGWGGPPRPAADGRVDVSGFNAFLARDGAPARSPVLASAEFVRVDRSDAPSISLVADAGPEGGGPATVVVTLDRLLDDSIRAQRYVLRLERQEDGTWRLRSAAWAQRCRPGRGHEEFSPGPCV